MLLGVSERNRSWLFVWFALTQDNKDAPEHGVAHCNDSSLGAAARLEAVVFPPKVTIFLVHCSPGTFRQSG
jgi:hypothetical protein